MRIALVILIAIHGLIHLFGFLKAFGISEFNAISQPISRASGLLWLTAFLLFMMTVVLYLRHSDYWWLWGFAALIVSQGLILTYWSDAKFGTIANVIILLAVLVAYSTYRFGQAVQRERIELFSKSELLRGVIVDSQEIKTLPPVVQAWLKNSGVMGKTRISNVYLSQALKLKLKPDQEEWNEGRAEQYFTVEPPAFNWSIDTEMNPLLSVVGRDKFVDGKGEMQIKLLSVIPVADAKNHTKVSQASLQRYLAEIVWFPSAALSPHIQWEGIDEGSARATMEYKGTKGSGIFHFDEEGRFEKFVALRYKDVNDAEPTEWVVRATETRELNGIKIPTQCEASWNLDSGPWTWLKLEVTHIEYNVGQMPVSDSALEK